MLLVKKLGHDEDVARSTIAALQEQLSRVVGRDCLIMLDMSSKAFRTLVTCGPLGRAHGTW